MRVEVVADQCEANGVCEGIAPAVFYLGDRDEIEVREPDVPPELHQAVDYAVSQCPKAALRWAP